MYIPLPWRTYAENYQGGRAFSQIWSNDPRENPLSTNKNVLKAFKKKQKIEMFST